MQFEGADELITEQTEEKPVAAVDPYLKNAYDAYAEGTKSGYKMALIEAAKVLDAVLVNKNIPGKAPAARLLSAKKFIPNFSDILEADKKKNELIVDLEYDLSLSMIQTMLESYSLTVKSLLAVKKLNPVSRAVVAAKTWYGKVGIQKIALSFFSFVAAVLILSRTGPGLALVSAFLGIVDTVVSGILVLGGFGVVVIATFIYLENKRSRDRKISQVEN